jgi:Flp pilus assembly protein TadB
MNLVKKIYLKKTIAYYQNKINSLGSDSKISVDNFLLSRLIIELGLFIFLLLIPRYGILIAVIIDLIFHYLYTYFLIDSKITQRYQSLYEEGLIFFQMLKLSLCNTHDLRKSLEIVSSNLNNSMANDFKKSLSRNKYNNNLSLVFKDMEDRLPNQDIVVSLIDLSESNDYNSTLNKIINNLQEKNTRLIKKECTNLPLKLTVLSLTFIVSIVLLIIYLPNILSILG